MLAHMKRLDAKLKTVEQSLGEVKQQGTPTNAAAKQESGKPGKLDRANAARLASAEKTAAESRSTAEDAAEKALFFRRQCGTGVVARACTIEGVRRAPARPAAWSPRHRPNGSQAGWGACDAARHEAESG